MIWGFLAAFLKHLIKRTLQLFLRQKGVKAPTERFHHHDIHVALSKHVS